MIRPLGVSEFSDWQTKLLLPQPIGMSEPFNPKGIPTSCQNGKIQDRQGRGRRERASVRDRVQDPKATPQIAHYHRPNHARLIL